MRVGSWPTVIATVRTVEFRAGGVRVVFDLEVNGHWYQAEVTRTGWEPSLRSSLEGYEPGKPQSVQYDPDDPTQATAAWSTWRATRADRFLTFLALLGLVSAIGAGRELSELSPTA